MSARKPVETEPTMDDVRAVTDPMLDQFKKDFPNPTLSDWNRLQGELIKAAEPYFLRSSMLKTLDKKPDTLRDGSPNSQMKFPLERLWHHLLQLCPSCCSEATASRAQSTSFCIAPPVRLCTSMRNESLPSSVCAADPDELRDSIQTLSRPIPILDTCNLGWVEIPWWFSPSTTFSV